MTDTMKPASEYPEEIRDRVRAAQIIQRGINKRDAVNELAMAERNKIIDELIEGGMGPKEAMATVGLGRNAYYQRQRRQG